MKCGTSGLEMNVSFSKQLQMTERSELQKGRIGTHGVIESWRWKKTGWTPDLSSASVACHSDSFACLARLGRKVMANGDVHGPSSSGTKMSQSEPNAP